MKKIIFILLFAVTFESCDKNEKQIEVQNYLILKDDAIKAANTFFEINKSLNALRRLNNVKTVMEVVEIKASNEENALYIINYNGGGYAIVSADQRINPILSYSDSESFKTNITELPPPVKDWLLSEVDLVSYKKMTNATQDLSVKSEWDIVQKLVPPIDNNCPEDVYVQKGPLLKTSWDQGCSYNNLFEYCSTSSNCNKQWVGCVPVAMSQVMRYWAKPNSYNWAAMASNYGTSQTQALMLAVAQAVQTKNGCESSPAQSDNIAGAMNNLGYNAVKTDNFNHSLILQQLNWNRPVILCGGRKKDGISWSMYTNGHCWVADGYQLFQSCERIDGQNISFQFLLYHMNWGWGGYANGYFSCTNFNPGVHSFNYCKEIIYNITPY